MPLPQRRLSPDRIDFSHSLSSSEIESLVSDPDFKVLQTSTEVDSHTWEKLDSILFRNRPEIELRIYGFGGNPCDLSFVKRLSFLRKFSADCLFTATNVECITHLKDLVSLKIDIYDLKSFDFLDLLEPNNLKHLYLGPTFSKKPNLHVIERFNGLETLNLEGQQKGIEVVRELAQLQKLTLKSVTVPSLSFLKGLMDLWYLDIKLGGTNKLDALSDLHNVKYLELWQVKGLSDLAPIADMVGLQFLFLQSLPNVVQLPDLSRLMLLRKVYLENMKGLKDLSALDSAPALEEIVHVSAQGLTPSDYVGLLKKSSLKKIFVGFGSKQKNNQLEAMGRAAGIEFGVGSPFHFV